MQDLILKFLGKEYANIQFSPVPKGQDGDLAINVFKLSKNSPVLKSAQENISKPKVFEETDIHKVVRGSQKGMHIKSMVKEVDRLLNKCPLVEKTKIVGPYLNLFFKNEVFFDEVFKTPLSTDLLKNKNIVVEFSGPNTNKPLHLGHMRNHALGISMSNLLEAVGAKVHRVNIINDRGVHICKSMLAYQKWGNNETPEQTDESPDFFVGRYYIKFEEELKKDPSLKEQIQEMLVKWEDGDTEVHKLWKKMNGWTLAGHAKTYERQGIKFEKSYYESETYQQGKDIAEEGLSKGVFFKKEDGSIAIDLSDEGLDEKIIMRADGTSVYLTQDLAVATLRDQDFNHPDELIYTVADEQNYHFKVLFLCLEKLGILDRNKLCHLSYGLVNLPHGRMKSREGTVVDADMLMNTLSALALKEIQKRNPETTKEKSQATAEQIMNAAWKFALLTTTPKKTITYDPEKSLAFEGATGPYLQYAGVRTKSILKKEKPGAGYGVPGTAEKPLGVKVLEFPEVLNRAAENKNPTYLVTYLLELAQEWSSFYAENSVLNAETDDLKQARLALAQKVLEVLEKGLGILGIEIPEQM